MTVDESILPMMLDAAVPLRIAELQQRGGPDDADYNAAREFGSVLASQGDVLMYGGKPGEAAELANGMAQALAVMAFVPGGVSVFGRRWVAQ